VHVPVPTGVTVEPDTVQTPALVESAEKTTGRPELATAETVYGAPPTVAADGAVDVNVIDCTLGADGRPTPKDCWTRAAAAYVPLPGWSASIVQVPVPTNETDEPETVHTHALDGSAEKTTASPEVALAATVYAGSPATAPDGAVDVKLIACELRPTANDCCACGAAR
jgi:hypothetical protein